MKNEKSGASKPAPKITFRTILLRAGKTATGIKIPGEVIEKLGAGKKPPIKVTINGFTYRSTVAVMGGAFMVGVNAENRIGANVNGGDEIEVTIELDTEERTIDVPVELQKALNKNSTAKKMFETLSYSGKKALIVPVANAKTEETKNRNIEKAMNSLLTLKK
jgi:hypothetical protein